MKSSYLPETGDFIGLNFDPQAGRGKAGRRPALVVSPKIYNSKSGLALVCPVTSQAKGYPFEVRLPTGQAVGGVIVADHVKSVDWKARDAEKLGRCLPEVVEEVRAKLAPLLGL